MKLQDLKAYEIVEDREIKDLNSQGVVLRHKKSGARICLLLNDDENKVFYIAFRTPPVNSTGLTHILEHSVLCGSKEFPIKDPFIELVKGSLNTFLNAITYPDKTVYPIASCNDKDYQNLMHVYLDAVFRPNIYQYREIFCQEGWHYELEHPEDDLKISGVVYSEMKGAFSSSDDLLEREILNSLYPDTAYRFESGGDPKKIPDLSYEEFLDFHSKYYHPSNSYIYLYGNLDAVEKLKWLDEYYLSGYKTDDFDTEIHLQKAFDHPLRVEKKYSVSSQDSERDKTYLSYNWSVGDILDQKQYLAFETLDYALLSSQGAPLKQALLDAGIGKDIQGGYDNSIRQPLFSVIAKNSNIEKLDEFQQIIQDTLKNQVKQGINKEALLASVNHGEFRFREADFGNYPKGLMFGLQALDSWLYDDSKVFIHLEPLETYRFLREQMETGYFEGLIQKYLLDNPHVSVVTMEPERGLNAKEEKELSDKLQAYKNSLSEAEILELTAFTKHLKEYQEQPNAPLDLEKIPMLSRKDLQPAPEPLNNQVLDLGKTTMIWHDIPANGIVYLDLMFDAGHIPEELVSYLGVLKLLLGYLDTEDYTYTELANEVNLHTGGIHNCITVLADAKDADKYHAKFEVRISALKEKLEKAMELTESMLFATKFDDKKRLGELLAQIKSSLQSDLSESGHLASATRALSYYQPRSRFADLTTGIDFYKLVDRLETCFEDEVQDLKEKLQLLMRMLFRPEKLLISVTCDESGRIEAEKQVRRIEKRFYTDPIEDRPWVVSCTRKNEGFMDASQVQYVSLAGSYRDAGFSYTGAFHVLKTILSYDYLWLNIRVKGGAYGAASAFLRTGDAYFTSYRDPHLKNTLEVYKKTAEFLKSFHASERDMTKYVIGTISSLDTPLNPKAKGRRSLLAYLSGLTPEMMAEERREVIEASVEDIRALAAPVEAAVKNENICVIGNEDKIKQEQSVFDNILPLL
ncbi:Peptidase M16C associated [uncultured Roseburia sp.]|uniref:Insulinase family protein n=1 Tax=Brotonthovivens ammoniilytica TaxID=2981725 RepID=A0ABT2TIV9_9FIRM|nr:insulinase family protein [Brotonthovivens ammoniilytica]MCU6761567.1 insulinase family protein [Brotonthovivens ammoniilytica]SCI32229.1 Peptidase M16C associated [uncultured Roseburia sp.]